MTAVRAIPRVPAAVHTEVVAPAVGVVVVVVPGVVDTAELTALGERLRAVAGAPAPQQTLTAVPDVPAAARLEAGGIAMDLDRLRVTLRGREIALRYQEFRLLQTFLEHPGRAFSRRQLLQQAWDQLHDGGGRTVDVHVRRLREKLGPAAAAIVTVRGYGYRFEGDAAA